MANRSHRTRNPSANIARADDTISCGRNSRRPPLGSRRWSRNSSSRGLESPSWRKPCGKPAWLHPRQGRINPAPSIPTPMDYRALGLKVGLEIHQQLATHKLFCEDASVLIDSPGGQRFRRRLRPTQSELGEIDAAAIEEAKRRLTFVYETTPNSCLVEADEEPPHPPNPEALDIAVEIALLLDAKVASEVDFMRKIVIDGSNTSGFQRSALVALDGHLETNGKRIGVPTILLEEDAAQKLSEAELKRRDARSIPAEVNNLSDAFKGTHSKVVATALKKGGVVLGWSLPGFAGLLKDKLGPELAAHARVAGVAGIFHSDELPAYGITPSEVTAARTALRIGEEDAFVLIAEEEEKARGAIDEMVPRAAAAIDGVPPETREPRPDGTTVYSRPLPGKARMYPETDVPPIRVTWERLDRIREHLPERPDVTEARLAREHAIHSQQTHQLVQEGMDELFELIAREFGEPRLVATVLLYTFSELRRESLDVDGIPVDRLRELSSLLKAGRFAKEAVPEVLREMAGRGVRASEALSSLGVKGMNREELETIVDAVLDESEDMIRARGETAEKALMGRVMERVRGRADGKLVSEVLHARLAARVSGRKDERKKGKR